MYILKFLYSFIEFSSIIFSRIDFILTFFVVYFQKPMKNVTLPLVNFILDYEACNFQLIIFCFALCASFFFISFH